ncbi:MAG: HIT family protein [Pseudomonadales bacterium]|nr:HIT family protein [Pseudomonadales bacterium]
MFELDAQLKADTVSLGQMALCEVLLAKDANYPWLILVPMQANITEIYQLSDDQQLLLMQEVSFVAKQLETHCLAHKMNVAALGNVVSQLHMHVIARFDTDIAWPAPVWGKVAAKVYAEDELEATVNSLRALLCERLSINAV